MRKDGSWAKGHMGHERGKPSEGRVLEGKNRDGRRRGREREEEGGRHRSFHMETCLNTMT